MHSNLTLVRADAQMDMTALMQHWGRRTVEGAVVAWARAPWRADARERVLQAMGRASYDTL